LKPKKKQPAEKVLPEARLLGLRYALQRSNKVGGRGGERGVGGFRQPKGNNARGPSFFAFPKGVGVRRGHSHGVTTATHKKDWKERGGQKLDLYTTETGRGKDARDHIKERT